jgi:hypothetical protein
MREDLILISVPTRPMRQLDARPDQKPGLSSQSVRGLDLTSSVAYRLYNFLHPQGVGSTDRTNESLRLGM